MFAEGIEHWFQSMHPATKLSNTEKASASFLGGALSTLATIPMVGFFLPQYVKTKIYVFF